MTAAQRLSEWLGDRRLVATLATAVLAVVVVAGLGLASVAVEGDAAAVDDMNARLDELLRRPLPPPAPPPVELDPSEHDIRLIAASSAGAAASTLQDLLSAHATEAGLRVDRMTVEPATGEDENRTVELRLEGSGGMNALQAALFRIETGFPYLFVDELELQRPVGGEGDDLVIVATIRAGWKGGPP